MQDGEWATRIALRWARSRDFDFCARLYLVGMAEIIRKLGLDADSQAESFQRQWVREQVRIVVLDATDIGWLQTASRSDELYLGQIFVDPAYQRQGIGTEIMRRLIDEARHAGRAITLEVVKINPALRLYERLGFRTFRDDEFKHYMRLSPNGDGAAPT